MVKRGNLFPKYPPFPRQIPIKQVVLAIGEPEPGDIPIAPPDEPPEWNPPPIPPPDPTATLREWELTGGNYANQVTGVAYILAQTFTIGTLGAAENANLTSIKIRGRRASSSTFGDINLSLKAVDGAHKPTGAALATGTVSSSAFSSSNITYVEIEMTTYEMVNATEYAIVVEAPDAGSIAKLLWYDTGNDDYTGGTGWRSTDDQSTWTSENDLFFEVWGSTA